jgi:hypothetical protein
LTVKNPALGIAVITDDDKWSFRKEFWLIASDVELKYDLILDIRVISEARWQHMADIQAGWYQNISRDAMPIRFYKKTAPVGV